MLVYGLAFTLLSQPQTVGAEVGHQNLVDEAGLVCVGSLLSLSSKGARSLDNRLISRNAQQDDQAPLAGVALKFLCSPTKFGEKVMHWKNGATVAVLVAGLGAYACNAGAPDGLAPGATAAAIGGKADQAGMPSSVISWSEIESRCTRPDENSPIIYSGDYRWDYTPELMAQKFEEMYQSDKRLFERAYFDEQSRQFLLPGPEVRGGAVVLPNRLIENVRRHIEKALLRGYAEYVFFPDMGHTHLFYPEDLWETEYSSVPVPELSAMYSRLFNDPELRLLYHTAEQLQMLDDDGELLNDRHLRWRFFTRNLVGDNAYLSRLDLLHEPTHTSNTSRNLPGHRYHGSGFAISANKDGCFPYVVDGVTYWFDVSLSDPASERSSAGSF
jgi:hypothetical protein